MYIFLSLNFDYYRNIRHYRIIRRELLTKQLISGVFHTMSFFTPECSLSPTWNVAFANRFIYDRYAYKNPYSNNIFQ